MGDQTTLIGDAHSLRPRARVQLGKDGGDMMFHRLRRQIEAGSDVGIPEPLDQEL
jgi:hypothetical protein